MATYAELAEASGIALPGALRQLIDAGLTGYGDIEAWRSDWKGNTLAARPVLSCMADLEWIDAGQASETVQEWLNPAYQHGRRFLPFAETGAGDAYCLTPTADGGIGVALVWHDSDDARIEWASFDAFAFDALLRSAQDCTHLIEDGFSPEESVTCVRENIHVLKAYLPDAMRAGLDRLLADAARCATGEPGALAGPDAVLAAEALLPPVDDETFDVVARWECGEA